MNVLPRLLYLFRNLPLEISEDQFRDSDKWISRFVWQGRKPRIKYPTLQLAKEVGGMGLPCLKNYYYAAQIIPLLHWSNGPYTANWKELESNLSDSFPIQAAIADAGLMCKLQGLGNPWLSHTLQTWLKVINKCDLHRMLDGLLLTLILHLADRTLVLNHGQRLVLQLTCHSPKITL